MEIEKRHISRIRTGDTILHNNKTMTVCSHNIKRDDFMGISIFGDCYKLGTVPVLLITNLN